MTTPAYALPTSLLPPTPDKFLCPISLNIMQDPVAIITGQVFERSAITEWFSTHNTNPMTNESLTDKTLKPKPKLKKEIHKWHTEREKAIAEQAEMQLLEEAIEEAIKASRGSLATPKSLTPQEKKLQKKATKLFEMGVEEALEFLAKDRILLEHYGESYLNNPIPPTEIEKRNVSPLYIICCKNDNFLFLNTHPSFFDKITPDGLNTIVPSGPEKNQSVLFLLSCTPMGLSLLERMTDKITEKGLNHPKHPQVSLLFSI